MNAKWSLPMCLLFALAAPAAAADLDLTRAVVVTPPGLSGPAAKAVQMLVEEVETRSMAHWDGDTKLGGDGRVGLPGGRRQDDPSSDRQALWGDWPPGPGVELVPLVGRDDRLRLRSAWHSGSPVAEPQAQNRAAQTRNRF